MKYIGDRIGEQLESNFSQLIISYSIVNVLFADF